MYSLNRIEHKARGHNGTINNHYSIILLSMFSDLAVLNRMRNGFGRVQ
jgi:hypothetical protein